MSEVRFDERSELGPKCPYCKKKLIVRSNRVSGNQFLGCPNWPDCDYTTKIPYEYVARKLGQKDLFSMESPDA